MSAQLVLPTVCQREVGFSLWASPTLLATTRVVCVTGLTSQIHFSPAWCNWTAGVGAIIEAPGFNPSPASRVVCSGMSGLHLH